MAGVDAPPSAPAAGSVARRFRAMGTEAHLIAVPDGLEALARAEDRLADLERRWSRFRVESELSAINRADGAPVIVSPETYALVAAAIEAWAGTGGLFDPTVHDALVAAGYDRSFDDLVDDGTSSVESPPAPGCSAIELDDALSAVRVPAGVHLDLGGIGKGRAVDLIHQTLRDDVQGACVNLGGDLRVGGTPPPSGWLIGLEDHLAPDRQRGLIALGEGAVATSTRAKRTWTRRGQARHHLIDPRTGRPAAGEVATVTVIAAEAMPAEILAKAGLVAGAAAGEALLQAAGVAAEMVLDDGRTIRVNNWTEYER